MLISEELRQLFLDQIIHEAQNNQIYKNISVYLNIIGLKNLSEFYCNGAKEELEHRDELMCFLSDLNIPNHLDTVPRVELDMSSIVGIAEFSVNREIETKNRINEMVLQANSDEDYLAVEFLLSFIKKQRNEISEYQYLYDNIKDFGEDMAMIRIFDQNFKS